MSSDFCFDGMTGCHSVFRGTNRAPRKRVIWVLGKSDNTSSIPCTCISACILTSAYFWGMYDKHMLHMFTPYSTGCNDKSHDSRLISIKLVHGYLWSVSFRGALLCNLKLGIALPQRKHP